MPLINPATLTWARETAGLSLEEAARAIGLKDARGVEGAQRLASLEEGRTEPTRELLLKLAQQYRRPLLAFYLAAPPPRGDRGEDFRTLPYADIAESAGNLDALVRDIRVRQGIVRSILESDPDSPNLDFIGTARISDGVPAVVAAIRDRLGFDLDAFRAASSLEAAFAYLRSRAEAAGIFVLLVGNLGSHHTALPVEAFRGFALADDLAPFVVINDQDARAAWAFTLLHEIVHLWLGQTGVSGAAAESRLEKFCNDVASRILLTDGELDHLEEARGSDTNALLTQLSSFASSRNLSVALVAYRAFRAGSLAEDTWEAIQRELRERLTASRADRRAQKKDGGSGPNYYTVRRHRVGPALIDFVRRNVAGGELTTVKAGRVLGVQPKNVGGLLAEPRPRVRRTA